MKQAADSAKVIGRVVLVTTLLYINMRFRSEFTFEGTWKSFISEFSTK
jgi:hypothetical protein